MKVYYFLGLLLRPFAVVSLNIVSYLFGTPRVRVVLRNQKGEILLLKTWLGGKKWSLPGGGVKRGESPAAAACRELEEETGIEVPENEMEHSTTLKIAGHQEIVFRATTSRDLPEQLPSRLEVEDAAWFFGSDLPPLEPLAAIVLDEVEKS